MYRKLTRLLLDDHGSETAEWVLVIAVLAISVVIAVRFLGTSTNQSLNDVGSYVQHAAASSGAISEPQPGAPGNEPDDAGSDPNTGAPGDHGTTPPETDPSDPGPHSPDQNLPQPKDDPIEEQPPEQGGMNGGNSTAGSIYSPGP